MMNDTEVVGQIRSVVHHSSFSIHHFLWVVSFLCLANLGCRPAIEVSEQAKPAPLLERDPTENGESAGRWAQWRGPNGSGIAPAGSPPIHFSDTEGYRWKTALPNGNSSPVIWDDVVLLTAEYAETDPPKLAVLCLDRRDGHMLWQTDAGTARGRTHVKNGYASASVTTDGQRIFASFGGLGLFCYDFAGKQQWRVDFDGMDHLWGLASSPVLFGETVIQLCDSEGMSFIAAYDKKTGREMWKTARASQGSWSTPVFVEANVDGRRRAEMIVQGGSGLCQVIAYDPTNGEELWQTGETTDLVTPLPVLGNGLVLCASGRNGPILAIRPGGSGDVSATNVIWKTSRGGPYIPSGVCYRNRLYLVGDGGPLCCYDPGDGRLVWQKKLTGPFTSSLIAADGRIYAVNERGTVTVFAAGDSFELLATNEMHSPCLATPAVADGDLFLRTKTDLYCFGGKAEGRAEGGGRKAEGGSNTTDNRGLGTSVPSAAPNKLQSPTTNSWPLFRGDPQATGIAPGGLPEKLEPLWTFASEKGGFESTAAIVDGMVYIGSTDGKLYALDLESGKKRWEFATPLGFSASAAVRDGRVCIGDADGMFYCLDAASGKQLWDFQTDGEINSSANFHNDNVLFGSQDSYLYCLDAASGKLVWKFQSQDQIRCFPTIVNNLAFVAGCDGQLHVIDLGQGRGVGAVKIDSPTGSSPAVMDGLVFVGTEGHNFLAIDPRQKKIVWRYENSERGAAFRSSAAVTPDTVIVGSRDKQVHALNPKTGRQFWSFLTKGRVDSSPVVAGRRVFVGSADGRLYALSVETGDVLWQFELGGAVIASPAVANGRLVIGNDSGELYCFGEKKK